MINMTPYFRLMRWDKPVGFFLLLWPTLWALWIASRIANHGIISLKLGIIFTVGVFIMRSAGCVINDIADRNFDPHVARTAERPLACKAISLRSAWILLAILFFLALIDVSFLSFQCFVFACFGAVVTILYPFMKRWISAPQCVLGIAFSLGIPMAFAAVLPGHLWTWSGSTLKIFILLWTIGLLWPVIYDTLYAMVDREDDLKIGVHSTAILLGRWDRGVIAILEIIWLGLWGWLVCMLIETLSWTPTFWTTFWTPTFYGCWLLIVGILLYESITIRKREPARCFRAFLNHAWIGGVLWFGLATAL